MSQIGPYSTATTLAKLDGRTREARLMRQLRSDLIAHIGGSPSATQRMLVERAVNLQIRISIMDQRFAQSGAQTDHDSRVYLAWSASVVRTLRALGLAGKAAPARTLADHLAGKAA